MQGFETQADLLFKDLPSEFQMWMSHGDKVHALPPGYVMVYHPVKGRVVRGGGRDG